MSETNKKETQTQNKKPTTSNRKDVVTTNTLMKFGTYYGHQTRQWNPKMKKYIQFSKNGIHMINVDATQKHLGFAYAVANKIASKGGKFLFVGTKNEAKKTIQENAERVGAFYINERWLGGTLTNFKTVKNSVFQLKQLEDLAKTNFDGYTKKEGIKLQKKLEKLSKLLGGIKGMRTLPDAIFVASTFNESTAIDEATKLGIPVFSIVDTNSDPDKISFVIPGNDDASKSVSLITTIMADAIATANGKPALAAMQPEEKIEVIGIVQRPVNEDRRLPRKNTRPSRDDLKKEVETKPASKTDTDKVEVKTEEKGDKK